MKRDVGVTILAAAGPRTARATVRSPFTRGAGKPMLVKSIQAFQARAAVQVVGRVLPGLYAGDPPPWIFQSDADRLLLSVGGRERSESVANGLEDLPSECEVVVIHDAARPLV